MAKTTTPDETTGEETDTYELTERMAAYCLLAVFVMLAYRSLGNTPDPMADLRERVATLEGKAS